MTPLEVRPYREDDGDAVLDVILPIQQHEFGIQITAADQPDLMAIPDFYQRGLGQFWVAVKDKRIVGTIGLKDLGSRQGALRKMFVSPEARGAATGAAGALLATLLDHAARHDLNDIFLGTTEKFLSAHRFYEKHGFVEIAKSALPPSFPVMVVDSKFYHLSLAR